MNIANLKKRIFFVLWAIPLAWWTINTDISLISLLPHAIVDKYFKGYSLPLYPGHVVATLLIILACYEYLSLLSRLYPRNGFWLIYPWLGMQIIFTFIPENFFRMQHTIYILLIIVALEAFLWGKYTGRWKRASLLFSGTIFLLIALTSLYVFYDDPFQKIFIPKFESQMLSQLGIISILAAIFLCDSAAYFAGSLFGKHHFSTISPKKTIEGSIAGLLTAVIICSLGWYFFADDKYPLIYGIILGVLIGIFAQIGDLLVSLIKRYFSVKDSSNIIPGHGGILDRFDSLFFTAPIVNLYLIIIDKIVA